MDVQVYSESYRDDFIRLNREWIETHFVLEPMDLQQLSAPREILNQGGEIFFVVDEGRVLGTCAMIPHGPGVYELAKMAVDVAARGRGLGDLLMETALAWARLRGASAVTLLSNTILEPAIALYRKHGFEVVHLGPHPDYERCNIEMRIDF